MDFGTSFWKHYLETSEDVTKHVTWLSALNIFRRFFYLGFQITSEYLCGRQKHVLPFNHLKIFKVVFLIILSRSHLTTTECVIEHVPSYNSLKHSHVVFSQVFQNNNWGHLRAFLNMHRQFSSWNSHRWDSWQFFSNNFWKYLRGTINVCHYLNPWENAQMEFLPDF